MNKKDIWDKENTVRFSVKLNCRTDRDIIEFLDGKNMQGVVKQALRELMKSGQGDVSK